MDREIGILLQQCQTQIDENNQLEQLLKFKAKAVPTDIVKLYIVILIAAALHHKVSRIQQNDISRIGADDVILIGFAAAIGSFLNRNFPILT